MYPKDNHKNGKDDEGTYQKNGNEEVGDIYDEVHHNDDAEANITTDNRHDHNADEDKADEVDNDKDVNDVDEDSNDADDDDDKAEEEEGDYAAKTAITFMATQKSYRTHSTMKMYITLMTMPLKTKLLQKLKKNYKTLISTTLMVTTKMKKAMLTVCGKSI